MASTAQIQLPIIDISNATAAVGKEVIDAARQYGFLYVDTASSCFSKEEIDSTFEMAKKFFASPIEEKQQVEIKGDVCWIILDALGVRCLEPLYTIITLELTWLEYGLVSNAQRDFGPRKPRERRLQRVYPPLYDYISTIDISNRPNRAINFGEFKSHKAAQPLPKSLIPHESDIDHFTTLCQKTCDRILTLLALGLGIPSDWFSSRHDPSVGPSGCTLRFLYYPSMKSPASAGFKHGVDVRAGAHSDYGSITLLFQRDGQPGLEILTPSNEWAAVPVRPAGGASDTAGPPPILVNIGDLLCHWTCGVLKSTVHRVVFPIDEKAGETDAASRDRYSIVYFCHPVHETELIPVPSKLVDEQRGKGVYGDDKGMVKVQTAREHLASRLAATYGGSVGDYHRE